MEEEKKIRMDSLITKFSLTNFSEKVKEATDQLNSILNNFYYSISNNWYSSKAVDFSSEFVGSIDEVEKTINNYYNKTIKEVCSNFNDLATKYGKQKLQFEGSLKTTFNYPLLLAQAKDGTIGMNIANVKRILNDFVIEVDDVINKFSFIPSYVILSKDTEGNKNYYFTKPDMLRNSVKDLTTKIVNEITTYINQEIDNVNKASMLAVEDLK
jgi:hypothetical protein